MGRHCKKVQYAGGCGVDDPSGFPCVGTQEYKVKTSPIAACVLAALSMPALACTADQHKWLQDQIDEAENNLYLNQQIPESQAPNYQNGKLQEKLRALYHAMEKCDDSIWDQQD